MSTEREKKAAFLTPLADVYEPTGADADRVFGKIQASLAASAVTTPSTSARASSPAPRAAAGGNKALLVGISCAVFAIGGAFFLARSEKGDVARSESKVDPPIAIGTASGEPREEESRPAIPSVSVDSLPSVNAQPAHGPMPKAAPPGASAGSAPRPDTLEREARILADARRARQAGEGDRALALLDEHAREFPDGWLASDRAAERIVVLCALGRREEASREAAVFLDGRPKTPLTRRVEMSCAGQP